MKKGRVWIVIAVIVGLIVVVLSTTRVSATSTLVKDAQQTIELCPADGLGWILCPLIRIATVAADKGYETMENFFLKISPTLLADGDTEANETKSTRIVWESFRNIANIILVIAFLIMVTSQVTGYGLNNYQVKKLMPKLIVAAVLVNLSFYITQLAVDISNLIGSSINELFGSIVSQIPASGSTGESVGGYITVAVAGLLAFKTANSTTPLISFVLPIIMGLAMIVVTGLLLLFLRQAAVILLAVFSPIAFACMLLPSTEKVFKTWKDSLMAVVLTYPIIALMFASGKLAGGIILISSSGAGAINQAILQLIGGLMQILPLVLVPSTLKQSIAKIPMVGATVAGLAGRMQGAANKRAMNSDLRKGQVDRWQKRKSERILRASDPNASRFRKLMSPGAGMGKLGRMRNQERIQQREQEIQHMERNLSTTDAQIMHDYANSTVLDQAGNIQRDRGGNIIRDDSVLKGLSRGGQDMLYSAGGKDGGGVAKMAMASAGIMSKEHGTSAAKYGQLAELARSGGITDGEMKRAHARANANSTAAGNLDLAAATDDAMRSTSGKSSAFSNDPISAHARNTIYKDYLSRANPNTLANASPESIRRLSPQIQELYRDSRPDNAFRGNIDQIINGAEGRPQASAASRQAFLDIR